ncbi:helix-turn-helix domain-containing protein [Gemmobacter denitrificans]|uniref:RodZ domain-containing protein n=1 Tax=Gemmobacter denitrificans TaxID=3123040 RepID=A0ABU8BPV6_9RHOB
MIFRRTKPSTGDLDKPKGFDDFELRLGDVMRGERATLGKSLLDVQRELKIKATYIAAIENCDVSAFETPGFIAGYIRSYARYLGMDPDWAFQRFCAEANFEVAHGMSAAATPATITAARNRTANLEPRDPLANPNAIFIPRSESWVHRIEPGAVGSVLVLALLIGALGYGGWSVLQEVQRVQLAPVDQAPVVVAEVDPLNQVDGVAAARPRGELSEVLAAEAAISDPLSRVTRPQALDLPVMVSRDGPIAAIDPRTNGTLAGQGQSAAAGQSIASVGDIGADLDAGVVQVTEAPKPGVDILAVRPSWVRIYAADDTVLFEKILDAGERYTVPQIEQAAFLRSGNSGSVYFVIGGQTYGPAAPGPQVVKNIDLSEEALMAKYQVADLTGDEALAKIVAENTATQAPADQ